MNACRNPIYEIEVIRGRAHYENVNVFHPLPNSPAENAGTRVLDSTDQPGLRRQEEGMPPTSPAAVRRPHAPPPLLPKSGGHKSGSEVVSDIENDKQQKMAANNAVSSAVRPPTPPPLPPPHPLHRHNTTDGLAASLSQVESEKEELVHTHTIDADESDSEATVETRVCNTVYKV